MLDETYRNAKKLDVKDFGLTFSPEQLGFSDLIKKELMKPEGRGIIFERYKINVYGGL